MESQNEYNQIVVTPFFNKTKGEPRKQIFINDKTSFQQLIKKKDTYCEIVGGDYQVKPHFDHDLLVEECKFDQHKEEILSNSYNSCIEAIQTMFPNKSICVSTRDPRLVNRQIIVIDPQNGKEKKQTQNLWKISYRFYVQDCRISYVNIKKLIDKYKYNDLFDKSVYDKNSILVLPFFKKPVDKVKDPYPTVLQPLKDQKPYKNVFENNDIFKYCASYIQPDFENLDLNFITMDKKLKYDVKQPKKDIHQEEDKNDVIFSKLKKFIGVLTPKRSTEYDTWLKVMITIINLSHKHNIRQRKCQELLHEFSKKSSKYNENDIDEWIDTNFDKMWNSDKEEKLGWSYLKETCIKEDDAEFYDKQVSKSYRTLKNKFEQMVFKCMNPVGFLRVNKEELLDDNTQPYQFLTRQQLKTAYEDWMYWEFDEKKQKYSQKPFIDTWCKDPNKQTFERIVFKPYHLDEKLAKQYFNIYEGIRAELLPPCRDYKLIQPVLDHILNVMTDKNKEYYEWYIQYLANIIQNPTNKSGVIVVFQGKQGCGKNIIIDAFANGILGSKLSISTSNPERVLLGNFNACALNKIYGVMNEMGSDIYGCINKLKDLATAPTMVLEKKGIDGIPVDNYINLTGTTNNTNPVNISIDDRRIVWYECNNEKVGDEEYFNKLAEILEDDKCISALYHYFKEEVKITIQNFQKTRPITEAYKRIQKLNLPSYVRWLLDYHQEGNIIFKKYKGELNCVIYKNLMFKEYMEWCEKFKYTSTKRDNLFHHLTNKETGISECLRDNKPAFKINKELFEKWLNTYKLNTNIEEVNEDKPNYMENEESDEE